jgi:hypothetical protein
MAYDRNNSLALILQGSLDKGEHVLAFMTFTHSGLRTYSHQKPTLTHCRSQLPIAPRTKLPTWLRVA